MSAHIVFGRFKYDDVLDSSSFVSETVTTGNASAVSNANQRIAFITALANNVFVSFSATGTPNTANVSSRFLIPVNTTVKFTVAANTKIGVLDT